MRIVDIKCRLESSLETLVVRDGYLLQRSLREEAISHRLGMYLQGTFPEWDVDCEWDKDSSGNIKEVDYSSLISKMQQVAGEMIGVARLDPLSVDGDAGVPELINMLVTIERQMTDNNLRYDDILRLWYLLIEYGGESIKVVIRPDIIVHRRGLNDNLVVIEAKKSYGLTELQRTTDLIKLVAMMVDRRYDYRSAFFVEYPNGSNFPSHRRFAFSNSHPVIKLLKKKYLCY